MVPVAEVGVLIEVITAGSSPKQIDCIPPISLFPLIVLTSTLMSV